MQTCSWELLHILDSLDLQLPFETDYIALTGRKDPRVASCIAAHPAAKRLLDGFTDAAGRGKRVTALLMRTDTPSEFRKQWVIRSLRNVLAICSVTAACQNALTDESGSGHGTMYSSFFRFYPLHLSPDGKNIVTDVPAYRNLDRVDAFSGRVSPDLPNTSLIQPQPDKILCERLVLAWQRMVTDEADPKLAALFRSLDVAFHASSVTETFSTYEQGIRIGLWVTAFEILANIRSKRASLDTVLDMLNQLTWDDARLNRVWVTERGRGRNLVCGLYADLYKARNDYVHGNPVLPERALSFKDPTLPPLSYLAPVILKGALHIYLGELGFPADDMRLMFERPQWEEALLKAMPAKAVVVT